MNTGIERTGAEKQEKGGFEDGKITEVCRRFPPFAVIFRYLPSFGPLFVCYFGLTAAGSSVISA